MALITSTNLASFHLKETEIPFSRFTFIHKHFGYRPHRKNMVLRSNGRNAPILPKVRAQNLPGKNVAVHQYSFLNLIAKIFVFVQIMFQNPSFTKLKLFSGYNILLF
jgi:hypothetical protein